MGKFLQILKMFVVNFPQLQCLVGTSIEKIINFAILWICEIISTSTRCVNLNLVIMPLI